MPEGHTIRRAALDQSPLLVGGRVAVTSPNRRFESGAAAVDGRTLRDLDTWGKHLFYFFEGRRVLHVHLGLEGRFRSRPVTWASVRLTGSGGGVDVVRPRICAVIDEVRQRRIVAALGPDPLRGEDGSGMATAVRARSDAIGAALLDQSLLAGIGNIYRAEILFACGIHPGRPSASITDPEWERLWSTAALLLAKGVRDRGDIITVERLGSRKTHVYGQRLCLACGTAIRRWDVGSRPCYACESCQPPTG